MAFIQQEKVDTGLKLESTKLVAKLAAFSELEEPFTSKFLGELFQSSLSVEKPAKADKVEQSQLNSVYISATEGIELSFDALDVERKALSLKMLLKSLDFRITWAVFYVNQYHGKTCCKKV